MPHAAGQSEHSAVSSYPFLIPPDYGHQSPSQGPSTYLPLAIIFLFSYTLSSGINREKGFKEPK